MKFSFLPIYHLKKSNREHIVSKLKTGDAIVTKSVLLPLYVHYGIIERDGDKINIIHLHPQKINSSGGNLVKEPLSNYLVGGREIVSVENTNLTKEDIDKIYENLKDEKYDYVNYNCEHFVNFAKGDFFVSKQILKYTSILLIGGFVYYLIRNKKI
jgi:hypothetical protein